MKKIKFLLSSIKNLFRTNGVFYVTEIESWVIKEIGKNIQKKSKKNIQIIYSTLFLKNSSIHFGSLNSYLSQPIVPFKSNKIIVTWYHIPNNFSFSKNLKKIKRVDYWIVTNSMMKTKLINLGIETSKLILISMAVEDIFLKNGKNHSKSDRDTFKIGSFLKDGSGWNEKSPLPKFIKGPDILIKTLKILHEKFPIEVKLSGPGRGFVIEALKKNNIPYEHKFFSQKKDLIEFYKSCDICLITSREEGGPLSLLESISLGIPVVSTKVGMAPDMIRDSLNGFLTEIDDVKELVSKISQLITSEEKLEKFSRECRNTKIKSYNELTLELDLIYDRS